MTLAMIRNDWADVLREELEKPYYKTLLDSLENRYRVSTVYPERSQVFNALNYTSYEQTKVVILGQDPYHGPQQAHGLSFSVRPGVKPPPSLLNIYKELNDDLGCPIPDHGCLLPWAKQGVLLLNTVLTVEEGQPFSHQRMGWERFTDRVVEALNERERPAVFLLWGNHAQEKAASIDTDKHHVIASAHPSPLAARRGFFGSRPFSRANAFLRSIGSAEIDWSLSVWPEEE